MTLQKLKDKITIDESVDQVNVVFPDQYGRLTGLKLNAEYFLEVVSSSKQPFFEYKYNPFRFDILGKMVDFDFPITKSVLLKPEMSTFREMCWLNNEALVFADVCHPDTGELLPYCPRNMLKQAEFKGIDTQVMFTFMLAKFGKDEKEAHQAQNKGMLTLE